MGKVFRQWKRVLLLGTFLACRIICVSAEEKNTPLLNSPFVILNDRPKLAMQCVAHAHGTPEEAMEKLRAIILKQPAHEKVAIGLCRYYQVDTLKMFAPAADTIYLNPFAVPSKISPKENENIWPGFDHPFINQLRLLRKIASTTELVAIIDLRGEPDFFVKRRASIEEIQWMVLAVIGANYNGIVWRECQDLNSNASFQSFENKLQKAAMDFTEACPVDWVEVSGPMAVSALRTEKRLFVVLLARNYLTIMENNKEICLPLAAEPNTGTLNIRVPAGITFREGTTLSAASIPLKEDGQGGIQADYRFEGPGEMLIFTLAPEK